MGSASDRFGARRHPLFPQAKELVKAALRAATTNDAGPLAALLDARMDTMGADEFEAVIGMATKELRQRQSATVAVQMLVSIALDVSENGQRESDGFAMQLFCVVLRFAGHAEVGEMLSPIQLDAVVQAMVRHRLLAPDAPCALLPSLLWPERAQAMKAGQVYALSRALGNGDLDAASRAAMQPVPAPGLVKDTQDAPAFGTVALLVGVAGARSGSRFPLSEEMAGQAELGASQGLSSGAGYVPQRLLDDMHRALADFGAELGPLLGQGAVLAVQPTIAFAQASMHAWHLVRSDRALAVLKRTAQAHADGRMDLLSVGPPSASDEGFVVPVRRRVGGPTAASLVWPVARYEPPRDALIQLLTFLQPLGVAVERSTGSARGGPLH